MTAQDLIDTFEAMADAPNGVDQLRSLVLGLAFSGRIVSQDPIKKGSELLARVKAEQEVQAAQGRGNRLREVSDIDDPSSNLPAHWAEARLGSLGLIFSGNSIPASKKRTIYSKVESGYPYIATKDVGYRKDEISCDTGIRIPFDAAEFQVAHSQSVLICSEGGSAGRKMGMPQQDVCFGNKLIAIETFEGISAQFIHYYYMTTRFQREFEARKTGIIGGIAIGKFVDILVPIPPREEQLRIVAKVDELMSLLDRLEAARDSRDMTRVSLRDASLQALQGAEDTEEVQAAWSRISKNMQELFTDQTDVESLRHTVLQLAVRGRLGTQYSDDVPAAELLRSAEMEIGQLVAEEKIRKPKALPPIDPSEIPYEVPSGWAWSRIGEITRSLTYGSSAKSKERGMVPVLRMGNLQGGEIDWSDLKFTSDEAEIVKYDMPPMSVLFNRTNSPALVGKTAIYRGERKAIYAGYLIRLELVTGIRTEYINYFLNSPDVRNWCWRVKTDGVSQSNINAKKLSMLLVPIPPSDEQVRIVATVKALFEVCLRFEEQFGRCLSLQNQYSEETAVSLVG